VEGVPVYDSVREAVDATRAKASVLFVPAPALLPAAEEALRAGIRLLVVITEHVPIRDTLKLLRRCQETGAYAIGPNSPGVIVPSRKLKLGIMPAPSFLEGGVALFSRSGTLMYEVADTLSLAGLGQHVALGVGGDPISCTTLTDCLDWARAMDEVRSVVVVGEIGGDAEERLAEHALKVGFSKPLVAYIAGRSAPREKRMGHAGAIIYGDYGTAESKIAALRRAGAKVASTTSEIPSLVESAR
jgi:succinyl-CoA synthetase alpha subunit